MTRASDLAKLLGAGATILDGTTISTADNTDQLTLISTDADANVGPNLNLFRNSGSPADDDVLGLIIYNGRNDNSQDVIYARQVSYIKDASDGTEDGQLSIQTMVAGTIRDRLNITPTEIVLNEDSQDLDFRVESNGNANALFVDGGNDSIGVKTASPSSYYSTDLVVGVGDNGGITIANTNTAHAGCIMFADGTSGSDRLRGQIVYDHNDDSIGMWTNATNALSISSSGTATIANGVTLTDGNLVVASGHGIDFSAAGNAGGMTSELLDDYEEGTFTISLGGCDVGGLDTTAYYTKIGQQVFFNWYSGAFDIANASGAATFGGLPFTASNGSQQYGVFSYVHGTALTGTTGGYIAKNTNYAYWVATDTTNSKTFINGSGQYIMISGHYQTDS